MKFEQFQEQVLEEMKARFPNADLEVKEVTKLQEKSYTGLSVRGKGESVAVSINLPAFFEDMNNGMPLEQVMEDIEDFVLSGREHIPRFDLQKIMNYEKMKNSLFMQMIPIEGNERKLKDIPYKVVEDMAVVYRFEIDKNEDHTSSMLITNHMIQTYGISVEQLHMDALEVMTKKYPPYMRNLVHVMRAMMADVPFMTPDEISPLWVASIDRESDGAVAILYPGFLDQAAEELGGNFFVLPSSVHETLFVADNGRVSLEELEEMVRSANEVVVPLEERLSNTVFHYDSEAHVFESARSFEMRMTDKENFIQETDMSEKETINVLLVEPFQHPKMIEIANNLEAMQRAVDGYIEVTYPFEEPVGLIMNEQGKINGLPLNRALYDENGEVYDVIAGSFLVVGLSHDNFSSLTSDQLKYFEERFHQPETFVRMGKGIMAIPVSEEKVKSAHRQMGNVLMKEGDKEKGKDSDPMMH